MFIFATRGQLVHPLPVVGLVVVADETHQSSVIRKLEEVGAVGGCAVVGQQGVEQGAEHTSLGGPCTQRDGVLCVVADPYRLLSGSEEVQQPVAERGAEAKFC